MPRKAHRLTPTGATNPLRPFRPGRLAAALEVVGLSHREAAALAGTFPQTIDSLVSGKTTKARALVVQKLAAACAVPATWLEGSGTQWEESLDPINPGQSPVAARLHAVRAVFLVQVMNPAYRDWLADGGTPQMTPEEQRKWLEAGAPRDRRWRLSWPRMRTRLAGMFLTLTDPVLSRRALLNDAPKIPATEYLELTVALVRHNRRMLQPWMDGKTTIDYRALRRVAMPTRSEPWGIVRALTDPKAVFTRLNYGQGSAEPRISKAADKLSDATNQ